MTNVTTIDQEKKPPMALTAKSLFSRDDIKAKFQEMMGKKAQGFITSVLQIVTSNALLAKADPWSIYNTAAVAATLDLPLNNSLGFAYIVPYKAKQSDGSYKEVAQFQMGYKGFIQLAQRSGQFKTIASTPIYEGQLIEENPLTGFRFDFSKKTSDVVVGYAAYFSLINGFEKTLYMTIGDLKKHGTSYSATFKKGFGLWKDNFDAMASKTVLKLLLSKFAPLSIEMQKAVIVDQGVINNEDATDITYVDHDAVEVNKEAERVYLMIQDAKTLAQLEKIGGEIDMTSEQLDAFDARKEELKNAK